ncbi:MAG: hypothetical protein ACW9W4_02995 [Candidatus Nitrosopumilus sp. bin_7KS]
MTILKQNRISMIACTSILTVALAFGGFSFASHSFEAGVAEGTIPDNTHIRLDGMTLPPGGVFPLYDASPNYVSGHFLLTSPCEPVSEGDDTYQPLVTAIAGHIDEHASGTHMEPIPLFYINTVSSPAFGNGGAQCVFHAHIPDPLNGGAPRVTDIDLVNLSGADIEFKPGHIVDINVQRVLGSIADDPYTGGPVVILERNVIYDLNDADHTNDGLGHSSQ